MGINMELKKLKKSFRRRGKKKRGDNRAWKKW